VPRGAFSVGERSPRANTGPSLFIEDMSDQRRQHQRAPRAISATVSRNCARFGTFRVINLSAGGALFRGSRPAPVGEQIDVALSLPTGTFIDASAVVLREGRLHDRPTFAVMFANLPPESQAAIDAVVRAALEELQRADVLVVDYSEPSCRALGERLLRLGLGSYSVTTALEALHTLAASHRFRAGLIGLYLGADDGREVLVHLGGKHPRVRRVLMAPTMTPAELLSAAQEMPAGAPHAVLAGGWSDTDLRRALQL
jgi:hypothetical protein